MTRFLSIGVRVHSNCPARLRIVDCGLHFGRIVCGGRQPAPPRGRSRPSLPLSPLRYSRSFSARPHQHQYTHTHPSIIMSQQQDYKFEGWNALDKDSVKGNMVWKEYEPKAFAADDVDIKIMYCVRVPPVAEAAGGEVRLLDVD